MSQKAEYRNAIRSKNLIKKSFLELLRTKPLEKVTVTDIVNLADINRGTFYTHYSDINKLIHAIEDEIVQTICSLIYEGKEADPIKNPLPLFLKISGYLSENQEMIFALMRANNTSAFAFQLPDLITGHLMESRSTDNALCPLYEAKCRFYIGGAVSLYTAWFHGSLDGSLEDVAYTLAKIISRSDISPIPY